MKCPICDNEFEGRPYKKYCSQACCLKASNGKKKRAEQERIAFELEWAAWKRDFARGKTVSNLGVRA